MNDNIRILYGGTPLFENDTTNYFSDEIYNNPVNRLNLYANMFATHHLGFLFNIIEANNDTDLDELPVYAIKNEETNQYQKINVITQNRLRIPMDSIILASNPDLVIEHLKLNNWDEQSIWHKSDAQLLETVQGKLCYYDRYQAIIVSKELCTEDTLLKLMATFIIRWTSLNEEAEDSLPRKFLKLLYDFSDGHINNDKLYDALDKLGDCKDDYVVDGLTRIYETAFNNLSQDILEQYHSNLSMIPILQEWIDNLKTAIKRVNDQMKQATDVDSNIIKDALVTMKEYFKDIHIYACDPMKITFLIDTYCDIYSVTDFKLLLQGRTNSLYNAFSDKPYIHSRNQLKGFLYDMFANKRYLMRFVNLINLEIRTANLERARDNTLSCLPTASEFLTNCHIALHDCFYEAKTVCKNALRNKDYDTFFSQLLACVKQITIGDSVVLGETMRMLSNHTGKCLLDTKTNEMVSIQDAIQHYNYLSDVDHELTIDELEQMTLGDDNNETL